MVLVALPELVLVVVVVVVLVLPVVMPGVVPVLVMQGQRLVLVLRRQYSAPLN